MPHAYKTDVLASKTMRVLWLWRVENGFGAYEPPETPLEGVGGLETYVRWLWGTSHPGKS